MSPKVIAGAVSFATLLALTALWGQEKPKSFPVPPQQRTARPAPVKSEGRHSAHAQASCAEEAGISKAVIQQRQSIQRSANQQVASVCADPSLTQQQQREEIRKIRQNASKESDSLLTPQQLEELKACQRARAQGTPSIPHPGPVVHNSGPCAGIR